MADPVRLTLLGPSVAHHAGRPIRCASKKAFALFAFLALNRRPHSRRGLAALFWGGRDDEAARASLRATLYRLPAPLAQCLAIERESLALVGSADLTCDVTRLEALAQNGDVNGLQEAAGLYQGHLLQDFDADATPEFDDWLHRERARLKQVAYEVFDRVIAAHYGQRANHSREAAVAFAHQWTQSRRLRWLRPHLSATSKKWRSADHARAARRGQSELAAPTARRTPCVVPVPRVGTDVAKESWGWRRVL